MQKLPAQKEWEDHVNSLKSIKISTNQEKLKQTLINSVK